MQAEFVEFRFGDILVQVDFFDFGFVGKVHLNNRCSSLTKNYIYNQITKGSNKLKLFVIQQSEENMKIRVIIYVLTFVAKMRTARFQLTRRRELLREWGQLELSNIQNIRLVVNFVEKSFLSKQKRTVLLAGLEEIRVQSQQMSHRLNEYLSLKQRLIFGEAICDMCCSYDNYLQCLRTFIEKKAVLKQMSKDKLMITENSLNPTVIEENFQRMVFRSYQVAIILKTYIKFLSLSHSDRQYFLKALDIITGLNKKYQLIIKQGQKEREVIRIENVLGKKISQQLVYSKKCSSHQGEVRLHVFESMMVLERDQAAKKVSLDMFSQVYVKEMEKQRLICVLAREQICYFYFQQQSEINRFMAIMRKVIGCLSVSRSAFGEQSKAEAAPFLLAKVIDYRHQENLKEDREVVICNISRIKISFELDISLSMMGSCLHYSQLGRGEKDENQPKQLNQTVLLTLHQLQSIRAQAEQNYNLGHNKLGEITFGGGIFSSRELKMVVWQAHLNSLFRIGSVIDNPIWLLKQLRVTQVIYESIVSQQNAQVSSQLHYCQLCSNLFFTTIRQFLEYRQVSLKNKYTLEKHRYCSNIFNRLKLQMLNIPVCLLENPEELYLWHFFREGGIDYAFHKRVNSQKRYFVKVAVPSLDKIVYQLELTKYTLVSEAIDEICFQVGMPALMGYRLLVSFKGEEALLGLNERLFPIVTEYNIRYIKKEKQSFFKRLKSLGSYLQLFEQGFLMLRRVIFYPYPWIGNRKTKVWEVQQLMLQFKSGKLVGLTRQVQFQLLILFFVWNKRASKQEMSKNIKERDLDSYVPLTIDIDSEDAYLMLDKIYAVFKTKTLEELEKLMTVRAQISPLYQKYVVEMEVVSMSPILTSKKSIHSVLVGLGWDAIKVFTVNHHLILELDWGQSSVRLIEGGLAIDRGEISVVVAGRQLYEIKNLCVLYKSLKSLAKSIKS